MKRFFVIFLVLCIVPILFSCSKQEKEQENTYNVSIEGEEVHQGKIKVICPKNWEAFLDEENTIRLVKDYQTSVTVMNNGKCDNMEDARVRITEDLSEFEITDSNDIVIDGVKFCSIRYIDNINYSYICLFGLYEKNMYSMVLQNADFSNMVIKGIISSIKF